MFILRDLLTPLQEEFSNTKQGQKRKVWFAYTLLAVVVPFTSSITSNLLRALQTLFGLEIQGQRFYAFMGSTTLPWKALWRTMWGQIPEPATERRIIVALDDSINPKSGRKVFGCGFFHDHAAKGGQSSYPWSQCILAIGLLKKVKSRWACIPLDLFFLDPPCYNMPGYNHDFKTQDHHDLKDILAKIKGTFIMTINDTPETRKIFKQFNIEEITLKYSTVRSVKSCSKIRTELLISNLV